MFFQFVCYFTVVWLIPASDAESCTALPPVDNSIFFAKEVEGQILGTYLCIKGFHLVGEKTLFCNASKQWNASTPTCHLGHCPDPVLVNGEFSSSGPVNVRDKITFKCNEHYLLKGSNWSQCLENHTWVPPFPICKSRLSLQQAANEQGELPPEPSLNSLTLSNEMNSIQTTSGTFVFSQLPFFKLLPIRKNSQIINNSEDELGEVVFPMDKYEFDQKEMNEKCVPKFPWAAVNTAGDCGPPENPAHGYFEGRDFNSGSTITYYCEERYRLVGAQDRQCVDGEWDSGLPVCESIQEAPQTEFEKALLAFQESKELCQAVEIFMQRLKENGLTMEKLKYFLGVKKAELEEKMLP